MRAEARDPQAWERLVFLYTPLVYGWCRNAGLGEIDAADVGQEVFCGVARGLVDFRHERGAGTFRSWLRTITRRKIQDFIRQRQEQPRGTGGSDAFRRLLEVPADNQEEGAAVKEEQLLCWRAAELVRQDVEGKTWTAFWRLAVEGHSLTAVAAELGLSLNAAYKARTRVLARLRQEFAGLIDFEGGGRAPPLRPERDDESHQREACDGSG
jgi:RNA polymerase sigma-70 factor (ECF subfamily)